jgi:hypothetical protein
MVDPGTDGPDSSTRAAAGTHGPSGSSGVGEGDPDRVAILFDAVSYATATTVIFSLLSGVVAVVLGERFAPGVKYGLFVFGWLALGYGTLLLWPSAAWKDDDETERSTSLFDRSSGKPDTAFQRFVQRVPPARFRRIPDEERMSTGSRVLAAAIVMMAMSIVLEQAFGIGP